MKPPHRIRMRPSQPRIRTPWVDLPCQGTMMQPANLSQELTFGHRENLQSGNVLSASNQQQQAANLHCLPSRVRGAPLLTAPHRQDPGPCTRQGHQRLTCKGPGGTGDAGCLRVPFPTTLNFEPSKHFMYLRNVNSTRKNAKPKIKNKQKKMKLIVYQILFVWFMLLHIAFKSVILSIHSSDMFILRPKSTAKKF